MCPRFIPARFRTTLRLLLVGLCVVAHLAITIGFPVPTVSARTDYSSKPFPCQHHHCGCHSAEQCWRSCCCMSMREKLAWAKEHGVTPPDYVLVAAAEEAAEDEPGSCCAHAEHQVAECCSTHGGGSCCSKKKHGGCSECSHETDAAKDAVEWVIGIHAQKCQGLALLWITTGAIAPPPVPVDLPRDTNPPVWCAPVRPVFWQSVSQRPDVPPPRLS